MAYTTAELKALANQAERGKLHSLGILLRDMVDKTGALSVAELAFLDGITAGTGLASKALVLDVLVAAAPHFEDLEKRLEWMRELINSNMPPAKPRGWARSNSTSASATAPYLMSSGIRTAWR